MPRKQITVDESIRLNKFIERKPERQDEQFFYFGIWWNISKMIEYIERISRKPTEFSVSQLSGSGNMIGVDEEYALTTDLSKPGIIIDLTPHHILMIDGNHRFYKAKREGKTTFMAYHLCLREHMHFITDRDGLRSLNSFIKVAERMVI